MRTDCASHDAIYRRYKAQGAVGWDLTEAAYREREAQSAGFQILHSEILPEKANSNIVIEARRPRLPDDLDPELGCTVG